MHSDELSERAITSLKGIGPARAEQFARMGLFSLRDLLGFMPRGYLDFSRERCISDIEDGEAAAVHVEFIGPARTIRAKNGTVVTNVSIGDSSGNMTAVWFNQSFMQRNIPHEPGGYILGFMDKKHGARFVRAVFSETLPGVLPVYPLVRGLTQSVVRNTVRAALDACGTGMMQETLPRSVLSEFNLISLKHAIHSVHFPHDAEELRQARRRLAFEDALMLTIVLQMLRQERGRERGIAFETGGVRNEFIEMLPFELTHAQCSVMDELEHDMSAPRAMNRLIQGDVGSGKTVLAMYAMYIAMKNRRQSVLMVPTEILAEQHLATIREFLGDMDIRVELLTGIVKGKRRKNVLEGLADGSVNILVGTHAVIEDTVQFSRLGLVVVDEQHRFGVAQRAKLWSKSQNPPHVLVMTATPIPRTLAMTIYGDLDVSVIDQLPPGRKPVVTVHKYNNQTTSLYNGIRQQIREGRQVYIVFPLIKESEKLDLQNLEEGFATLLEVFPEFRLSKVHGKMKAAEKEEEMQKFVKGETQILVATTVIEVGVNVPNASVMVILNAERFGLSQLHQLRGRVGRGASQSYCILVTKPQLTTETRKRIDIMCDTNDGFRIAEADLKLRGPGDLEGTQQSGMAFDLKIADIARDGQIVQMARDEAQRIIDSDPTCEKAENSMLWQHLAALRKTNINWSAIS